MKCLSSTDASYVIKWFFALLHSIHWKMCLLKDNWDVIYQACTLSHVCTFFPVCLILTIFGKVSCEGEFMLLWYCGQIQTEIWIIIGCWTYWLEACISIKCQKRVSFNIFFTNCLTQPLHICECIKQIASDLMSVCTCTFNLLHTIRLDCTVLYLCQVQRHAR